MGHILGFYTLETLPNNKYAPVEAIVTTVFIGLTLTDTVVGGSAQAFGQSQYYEATGKALGNAGLALGVAVDAGGVLYGVAANDEKQLYESSSSLFLGISGAAIFLVGGPQFAPVGYALGSFFGQFIGDAELERDKNQIPTVSIEDQPGSQFGAINATTETPFNTGEFEINTNEVTCVSPFQEDIASGNNFQLPLEDATNAPSFFQPTNFGTDLTTYVAPATSYVLPPMPVAPPSGGNDSDQPDPSTPIYSQSPPDPPAVSDPTPPDIPTAPISNQPDPSTPVYDPPAPVYDPPVYVPPAPVYAWYPSGDGGGGGGSSSGPVILDLTGHGIKITQKTSSNQFFDMAGDGYEHLTAWAGAGNAVLFFDATGQGALTRADQVVFTDLDPSAKTDMQALLDVFDTNHDGKLDAGDASFADFFLDVTNANGTTSVETLAQAAVASINLVPSAVEQALPDGSSIDGETTYTTTSGTTGLAATVTFAFDANGYAVVTSTSTNSDGSTTIDVVTSAPSGGVVYERLLNTSSSGLVKTLTMLNAGGNVETIQTDTTVVNGTGSVETLTDYRYGTIASSNHSGALGTSVSTTGAEKLDSTQTTISTSGGVTSRRRRRRHLRPHHWSSTPMRA